MKDQQFIYLFNYFIYNRYLTERSTVFYFSGDDYNGETDRSSNRSSNAGTDHTGTNDTRLEKHL